MAKGICWKKKCVFRQWLGGNMYYCPFPRCFFEKREVKDERTK
jgi:hypothetical protein